MSVSNYTTLADIAACASLSRRIFAAIEKQRAYPNTLKGNDAAMQTSQDQRNLPYWMTFFAAQAGWDAAWASALVTNAAVEGYDPGLDASVITDAMILSAVSVVVGV